MQKHRQSLADLTRLELLLRQLKALRRVPLELKQFVAKRDSGSAVLLYSKAQRVLQTHGHCGLLRPVASECEAIMQVCASSGSISLPGMIACDRKWGGDSASAHQPIAWEQAMNAPHGALSKRSDWHVQQ